MSRKPQPTPEQVLRRLEWTVIRRLDGLLQGDYRTLMRGSGLDLADLREYQHHDDVRHIDWNVTARLQTPHVRVFTEDREMAAWFLLDLSPSVDFGSGERRKRELLQGFVGVLARLISRHGNRVGAMLYGARGAAAVDTVLPARGGRLQVLRLLQLIGADAVQGSDHQRQAVHAVVEDVHGLVEEMNGRRDVAALALPCPDGPVEGVDRALPMPLRQPGQGRRAEAQVAGPELPEVARAGAVVRAVPAIVDARADDVGRRSRVTLAAQERAPRADAEVDRVRRCHEGSTDELPCHGARSIASGLPPSTSRSLRSTPGSPVRGNRGRLLRGGACARSASWPMPAFRSVSRSRRWRRS